MPAVALRDSRDDTEATEDDRGQMLTVMPGLDPAVHDGTDGQDQRPLPTYQRMLISTLRAVPWMTGSSPAMTVKALIHGKIFMHRLDPGIQVRESMPGVSGIGSHRKSRPAVHATR
jgi:hypothetical protein